MCKFALMNVDSATALTELIFACSMKMKDKKRRCLRLVGEPTCASKKRRQTNEADHGASASRQTSGRRCWKPVLSRGIGEAADLGRRRGGRPRGVGVGNQCLPRRQTSEKRRQTTGGEVVAVRKASEKRWQRKSEKRRQREGRDDFLFRPADS
jgi:hypothetical protein